MIFCLKFVVEVVVFRSGSICNSVVFVVVIGENEFVVGDDFIGIEVFERDYGVF